MDNDTTRAQPAPTAGAGQLDRPVRRPRVQVRERHEHQLTACYKAHDLHIWRDDFSCAWYIQVRDRRGFLAYDGYWPDSIHRSLDDAVTEACKGAGLWTPNVELSGAHRQASPADWRRLDDVRRAAGLGCLWVSA